MFVKNFFFFFVTIYWKLDKLDKLDKNLCDSDRKSVLGNSGANFIETFVKRNNKLHREYINAIFLENLVSLKIHFSKQISFSVRE